MKHSLEFCWSQVCVAYSLKLSAHYPLELVEALATHDSALHDVAGVVACIEFPDLLVRLPAFRLRHAGAPHRWNRSIGCNSLHLLKRSVYGLGFRAKVWRTDIPAGECQVTASACQINPASSAFACACQSRMSAACCLARPGCAYKQGQEQQQEIRKRPYLGSVQERLQVASGKAVYGMLWIGCVAP